MWNTIGGYGIIERGAAGGQGIGCHTLELSSSDARARSGSRRWVAPLLFAAMLAAATLTACFWKDRGAPTPAPGQPPDTPAPAAANLPVPTLPHMPTPTYTPGPTPTPNLVDRAALIALYNTADGPNWMTNTNWLSDRPVGEWYGVTTNSAGRVVEVNLYRNWLSGPIPPELGNLSKLIELELAINRLTGPIPPELSNLSNLTYLSLGENMLNGRIPSELGNLSNLRFLNLFDNQLSGHIPPELGNLSNLRDMVLSDNELSGHLPSELGNLPNLNRLYLAGNRISSCVPEALRDANTDNAQSGLPFCN